MIHCFLKSLAVTAGAALALLSCSSEPSLVILHVNDTHSHYEPIRGGRNAGMGGVIERAAIVDSIRNAVGESNVLLLHGGDFDQGSSYYSEFGGEVDVRFLNAMKYDCVTLGNHEFDDGLESLKQRLSNCSCPVACANIDLKSAGLDSLVSPYVITERGGKKIGIIGLCPALKENVRSSVANQVTQFDAPEVVTKYAAELRSTGCNFIIVLSHSGLEGDLEIIPQTRGVDLVVGGHSHTFMDNFETVRDLDGKEVRIIQDGCFGEYIGRIDIR